MLCAKLFLFLENNGVDLRLDALRRQILHDLLFRVVEEVGDVAGVRITINSDKDLNIRIIFGQNLLLLVLLFFLIFFQFTIGEHRRIPYWLALLQPLFPVR